MARSRHWSLNDVIYCAEPFIWHHSRKYLVHIWVDLTETSYTYGFFRLALSTLIWCWFSSSKIFFGMLQWKLWTPEVKRTGVGNFSIISSIALVSRIILKPGKISLLCVGHIIKNFKLYQMLRYRRATLVIPLCNAPFKSVSYKVSTKGFIL